MSFYEFGKIKPRINSNVLLKLWDRFYLAQFDGYQWVLPLANETIRVGDKDEWSWIR